MSVWTLRVVTPPAAEVIDLPTAAAHCRIDSDSPLLGLYVSAARQYVETQLGRALITTQYEVVYAEQPPPNGWPQVPFPTPLLVMPLWAPWSLLMQMQSPLVMPVQPVQSIEAVSVGQWGQAETVLDTSAYNVDVVTDQGRVLIDQTQIPYPNDHVAVTFTAGYGASSAAVPLPIQHAILLMTGFLNEKRGDDGGEIPDVVKALLSPFKVYSFG